MRNLLAALLLCAAPSFAAEKPLGGEIPPGYRGVTLAVAPSEVQFLQPGDRVDIITVFSETIGKDAKESEVAATLFQNVLVSDLQKERGFVRLLMNPNEAQYATLVSAKTLKLAVRAKGDVEMHPMEMASLKKLFR